MANRKSTKLIVVHVTATPPTSDIGVKEVRAMHKARGWSDIGYHFVIRRNGVVEKGRPESHVGAHVQGYNSVSIGVSLVGGVDSRGRPEDNRTRQQIDALVSLLRTLSAKYPDARICGHRDLSPDRDKDGIIEPHEWLKACPCFDAIPFAASYGLPAADIKGMWPKQADQDTAVGNGPDARTLYLQKLLRQAGYEFGPVDGIAGKRTSDALKRFQKSAGFKETGLFDEQTVARLREMFEKSRPDPVTVTKTVTKEVTVEKPVSRKSTIVALVVAVVVAIAGWAGLDAKDLMTEAAQQAIEGN